MPRPRTPLEELEFYKSPNLKRALKRQEAEDAAPAQPLAKHNELVQLYEEIKQRRLDALKDVKENGAVIKQEKFGARGQLVWVKVINPALRIAQSCELQLIKLGKLIGVQRKPKEET